MGRIGYCREHILDAGLSVLSQKGYNGTGVKEIVDAAGVPKGSFYNHFTSKEAFVIEAVERIAKENLKAAESVLTDQSKSAKARILEFFSGGCDQMSEEEFHGGCLIGNLCLEMADENEAIRETTSKIMCKQIGLIQQCLQDAKESGELKEALTPEDLAEFIYYAWEGAIMRAKGSRDCRPFTVFKTQLEGFFK